MSTDAELIHVLDFCPALLRNDEPYPETVEVAPGEVFDYIPWSRHLWATLMPHSRIILFKSFLSRAFSDSRYQEARTVSYARVDGRSEKRQRLMCLSSLSVRTGLPRIGSYAHD